MAAILVGVNPASSAYVNNKMKAAKELPLPPHITVRTICNAVVTHKDVDGFNIVNVGRFCLDMNTLIPCTPLGVQELIKRSGHIWKALQEMNIVKAERKVLHPFFGDVYRLVTQDYVRQLYLEYTKVMAVDPPIHDFRWGKRAELEVSQKAVSDGASISQQTQALTSVLSSQGASSQRLLRM
uniref:MAGE domain-containing protein n=1 Tax=Timema monikensis TaxID=170555 RepID=A0A7R9EEZ6_9NEOP|nr:unnamed protein product [Timema monikensis]